MAGDQSCNGLRKKQDFANAGFSGMVELLWILGTRLWP